MRTLVAVDWAKEPAKRAAFVARGESTGFAIAPLDPPGRGWDLQGLLTFARNESLRVNRPVLIGVDAVLGLPRRYLSLSELGAGTGFLNFLRRTVAEPTLLSEGLAGSWNARSPFFSVPKGEGAFRSLIAAAGGRDMFWRQVEERTRANSVFALSGIPGTVGSGSRALWRELAACLDVAKRDFAVWPFEGAIGHLLERVPVVLAEVYPRATYALALCDELPAPPVHVAKTKSTARAVALRMLQESRWPAELGLKISGLERAAESEDEFDALMTAVALTRLSATGRLNESLFSDPISEGDILGVGALALQRRALAIVGTPVSARGASPKVTTPVNQAERVGGTPILLPCPIAGCDHYFRGGRGGWDAHVGSYQRHQAWHPELQDPEQRRSRFRIEFAQWFR